MEINIGDYIEGHKITCINKDPFVKNQMYIGTDGVKIDAWGDRTVISYHIKKGE